MIVALTRDSVAAGDDVDAPHARKVEIPDGSGLARLAEGVLRARYLPVVTGGATWVIRYGHAAVILGEKRHVPFQLRVGDADAPLAAPAAIHFFYAGQSVPEETAERLRLELATS